MKNKKNIFKIMQEKWDSDRVTDDFRHITDMHVLSERYEKYIKGIDFENKTVIDYGCGGGWFGEYLFKEKGIKKYIGFDICKKSITAAKKKLKDYDAEIIQVKEHIDFSKYKADIFTTMECIQHFPARVYLINFLKSINESKIPELMIQYRRGRGVSFNYKNVMTWMCKLPVGYIDNHLTKYESLLEESSDSDKIQKAWIHFKRIKKIKLPEVQQEGEKIEIDNQSNESIIIEKQENEIINEGTNDKSEISEI